MATVNSYINVDPANSPGGDGTSNATSGANRAYASWSEWEAAEQTNLVTDGDIHIVHCDGGEDTSPTYYLNGWTTGASNYITIQTNTSNPHDGTYDDTGSVYALVGNNTSGQSRVLLSYEPYTRFIGLQFGVKSTRTSWAAAIQVISHAATETSHFEDCLFRNLTSDAYERLGILFTDADTEPRISNCSFSEFDTHSDSAGIRFGFQGLTYTFADAFIQHNTFYNCSTGVRGSSLATVTSVRLRNNLFHNCTHSVWDDKGDGWHADSDYNVEENNESGEYELPGANSIHSATVTFTDATNGDFHTTDTDTLVSNNLYSDSDYATTTDIDGDARPSTGDVSAGYDHVAAAAAGGALTLVGNNPIFSLVNGGLAR